MNSKEKIANIIAKQTSKSRIGSICITVLFVIVPFLCNYLPESLKLILFNSFPWIIETILLVILIAIHVIHNMLETPNSLDKKLKHYRHPILLIDDNPIVLDQIFKAAYGCNFDMVVLKDLSDYRIVERFEIIVSDIFNLGPGENSSEVIAKIEEIYPFKIIAAMSNQTALIQNLPEHIKIFNKQDSKYPLEIVNFLKKSCQELDEQETHIRKIKHRLEDIGLSNERIEELTIDYIKTIPDK